METQFYNLYPEVKKVTKISTISVSVYEIVLFSHARISVMLYDINGAAVDNRLYTLENADYLEWGNSDTFIVNFAKSKIQEEFGSQ
jgi:hypothetical protein